MNASILEIRNLKMENVHHGRKVEMLIQLPQKFSMTYFKK
jgi:hypothetical protein